MAQAGTSPMLPPEDTEDAAPPAPARPARASLPQNLGWTSKPLLIARVSALAAHAQPLLTLGTASPGGSSDSGSSTGHNGFTSPATDLSPYAERPGPFVPALEMLARLPSALAAAAITLAGAPDMEDNSDLEAAVEVLARPCAPPPRVLRHQRSFPGALNQGKVGFGRKLGPAAGSGPDFSSHFTSPPISHSLYRDRSRSFNIPTITETPQQRTPAGSVFAHDSDS
jgi:hypothetical protein